tara:strand:- start:2681 stop:2947 length:267 start_codon:yes stop_codon:yes gene_type:complete
MAKITEHESSDVTYNGETIRYHNGRVVQTGLYAGRTLPKSPLTSESEAGDDQLKVSGSSTTESRISHRNPLRRGQKTRLGGKINPQDI